LQSVIKVRIRNGHLPTGAAGAPVVGARAGGGKIGRFHNGLISDWPLLIDISGNLVETPSQTQAQPRRAHAF
jgi:hypothetical protein